MYLVISLLVLRAGYGIWLYQFLIIAYLFTLLQTCLCVSLWLAQNKPDLLCCRPVYVWVCGSYKTNQIYIAADLFMCEFVARTKQTRSTLLQTCLCMSLWLVQNKPDLLCCRLVYVWVCGSYKTNQIYFAADLFMCEFVARTKQTRSTLLQTCLCGSLWLAQNKQDLLCYRLVYVWVCGSHKTNQIYFAADLFMCEFVARTKQTRSTLLQTCLCVSLWLVQNKQDLLCCSLVYVWVCGSHKTNQIYFAADLFMCEFVARTKQTRSTSFNARCYGGALRSAKRAAWSPMVYQQVTRKRPDSIYTKTFGSSIMLVTYVVNFRWLGDHLFGKELFILFAASAFRKLSTIYVFSYFPFGFEGRIWDLIVSVPDHCLSFYFAADLFTCEFVARTKQTRSTLLQTCLVGFCGSHKTNKIYFAADLFMCEFVARTKQTRSTLLQTCLVGVCGSHKTNKIYFAADLFMCEFVARTKQTRSTLLQTCLCVSLWFVQNKQDLLCCRFVYVWVCGSYKTNQIYFATELFMCEFVARTKQTRSTLLQTCLCVSLWLVQNKPDLLCYRLVYVRVCGSHKTNQIYFAADLFMCEFVARTKQTRSTLLQTCLCVSLWLLQNKPDLLCCRLVYVWVCGSY